MEAASLFLSLVLVGCAFWGDGDPRAVVAHDPDSEKAAVTSQQGPDTAAGPMIPTVAAIKVYFKLDPHLTRSLNVGDRWVSPSTFAHARQQGEHGRVEARAVGLDHRGRLMDRRLAPEWLAADSAMVSVSPTRGNSVTVTMRSPGESTLRVTHGEVSETLTLKATYDEQNDLTQLVVSRGGFD